MRTEYVKQLINTKSKNFSQTRKEWGDEIYQYLVDNTDRDWSRNGITMMFTWIFFCVQIPYARFRCFVAVRA